MRGMELRPRFAPPVPGKQAEEDRLLTLKEAMAYLRVSRSTLYRLIGSGQLVGHKVGYTWRFYLADLQACVDSTVVVLELPADGTPVDYAPYWYRCQDQGCACQQKYARVHANWYATWMQNGLRVRKYVGREKPKEAIG